MMVSLVCMRGGPIWGYEAIGDGRQLKLLNIYDATLASLQYFQIRRKDRLSSTGMRRQECGIDTESCTRGFVSHVQA